MEIERYDYLGNSNIGFYATVSNEQSIFPPEFDRKGIFDTDHVETYIARTRLVGLFTAGNSNCLLVPNNITDREEQKLEESDVDFRIIETRDTALGNLILANDKGAVISENLEDKREEIEDALEVPVEVGKIAGAYTVGTAAIANSHGAVIHRDASEDDAENVKSQLELEDIDIGTVNLGSPFMGSGALANDSAILVGEDTSGPEVGRIDRTMVKHN
ncbi:MAG: translation initiation factor IF-6 [Candidatus Nanosalina sp.]